MSLKRKTVSGVKWTTASAITLAIVQVIRLSILTRFLEKSDFGLIALVTLVLGFVSLFNDLGLSVAILHVQDIKHNEYSSLFWLNLVLTVGLYIILCGLSPLAAAFYEEPILVKLIPLMGLSMLIGLIGKQYKLIRQKELDFKTISTVNIAGIIISMFVAIMLAARGWGVYSVIYSTLVETAITSGYFYFLSRKANPIRFHFRYQEVKPFLQIGLYQNGTQLLNYFSNQLDIFLIGKLFSTSDLGVYNLGKQLALRPYQIMNPIITKVAIPAFAKIQTDKHALQRNFVKVLSWLSFLNFPIYLFLMAAAVPVIRLFYGESYLAVVPIFQILCIWGVFASIANPAGILTAAMGRTDLSFKWTVFRVLINPAFIFIASFGSLKHVAFSQAAFGLLGYWIYWRFMVYKLIQLDFKTYLNSILKEMTSGVIACIITYFVINYCIDFFDSIPVILLSAVIYTLIYFICSVTINKRGIVLISETLDVPGKMGRFPKFQLYLKKFMNV